MFSKFSLTVLSGFDFIKVGHLAQTVAPNFLLLRRFLWVKKSGVGIGPISMKNTPL